jgi:integrase
MSSLPAVSHQGHSLQLPVAIDYPAALALRQMALVQDELPKYLLAPEISALLHYVPDLHRKMLLATLWNTGARINEALALTRGDFSLAPPYPFVLATLKQRAEKAARTAGSARRQSGPSSGSAIRSPVRQPAADDGGHAENSSRASQQADRPNREGPHLGDYRPYRTHLAE